MAYCCRSSQKILDEAWPAGNFLTLQQGVQLFGADAMRITFADAGDSIDDANFVSSTANSAILRLTKELAWIQEVLEAQPGMRRGQKLFADRVFANEISHAAHTTKQVRDKLSLQKYYGQTFA